MKYNCDLIKDLLPLYLDKTASEPSTKAVEEHMNECEECRLFYQEMKKTDSISFKTISKKDGADDYLSLAKRLRRTKWYWRLGIGLVVGVIIYLSLMFSDGNRFGPMKAAYASNVVNSYSQLVEKVPIGDGRILYIFEDDGIYQNVEVTHRFLYWKYIYTRPNKYISDPNAEVQLIINRTYMNSSNHSLYIVYAVAVKDEHVAYIELGKKGAMQRQNINSEVVAFLWDKSSDWDGTNTWNGMIKEGELEGTAYASDGSVLYRLAWMNEPDKQDSYKWIPTK